MVTTTNSQKMTRWCIHLMCKSQTTDMNLTTGFFASETSWTLVDESGDVVWSENDYSAGINDYIYEGCMTTGCYTLTFLTQVAMA